MIEPKALLKQVFPTMEQDALAEMVRYARLNSYAPGTLLCREGAEESVFYIIGEGQVEITKSFEEGGAEHRLRTSGPGEFFGEMALIANSPRNANVRTLEQTTVLEIDKPLFIEMLRYSPAVALTMFRTAVERMRANDQRAMKELAQQKQEVERAYAELQVQENQRSDFLTTLAHELRTPLTSANGFMQFIKNGTINGAALNMAHERIGNGLEQVVSLVNDLLFVQEMDLIEPALRPVDLASIIERIVDDTEDDAFANEVEVRVEMPDDLPEIKADPDGLARALYAILDNAIKFTPNGGEIFIRVSLDGAGVNIAIQDPGIGIDAEFLPYIFERFRRIDSYKDHVFGGIGLGLAIAKHLITSFGGSISVQSEPDEGSVFTVRLPALISTKPGDGAGEVAKV
jgi:signal transduction histidine kinase